MHVKKKKKDCLRDIRCRVRHITSFLQSAFIPNSNASLPTHGIHLHSTFFSHHYSSSNSDYLSAFNLCRTPTGFHALSLLLDHLNSLSLNWFPLPGAILLDHLYSLLSGSYLPAALTTWCVYKQISLTLQICVRRFWAFIHFLYISPIFRKNPRMDNGMILMHLFKYPHFIPIYAVIFPLTLCS